MSNENTTTSAPLPNHHEVAKKLTEYSGIEPKEMKKRNRTIKILCSNEGRVYQGDTTYGWLDGDANFTLRGIYREKDGVAELIAYDYMATIAGNTVAVDWAESEEAVIEAYKSLITSKEEVIVPEGYPTDTEGNPIEVGKLYWRTIKTEGAVPRLVVITKVEESYGFMLHYATRYNYWAEYDNDYCSHNTSLNSTYELAVDLPEKEVAQFIYGVRKSLENHRKSISNLDVANKLLDHAD